MTYRPPNLPTKLLFVMAVFCLGLLAGWRATVTHLEVEIVSPCRAEVSAWGQTDLFVFSEPLY